jgi:large subunit ribosomal protein L5
MARLQKHYREKVVSDLTKQFGYKSPMQVPRLTKITLNMGVGEAVADKKVMDNAVADLTKIAGQKPVVTKAQESDCWLQAARRSALGCMVTLRGVQMYEFLDRFVTDGVCRVCATSVVFLVVLSMVVATTTSASKNKSFSRKSSTTRSMRCVV